MVVNRQCEKFKLSELSTDMFKCPVFVQGFMVNKDAEIQVQILTRLEQDTNLTLQKVAKDYNIIENFCHDTQKIEGRENFQMHAVQKETNKKD